MPLYPFIAALHALAVFGTFQLIARVQGPRTVFCVPLGRDVTAEDRARVRRVTVVNLVAFTAFVVLVATPRTAGTLLPVVVSLAPALALFREIYLVADSATGPAPARYAVPLGQGLRTRDLISPLVQSVNLLVVSGSALAFAAALRDLPRRIPLHWDAAGQVDRYGSPAELWVLSIFMVGMTAVPWGVAWMVSRERLALHPDHAERHLALELRRRRLIVRLVEVMITGANGAMAVLWLGLAWTAGASSGLPTGLLVVVLILTEIGSLIAFLPKLSDVQEEIVELAGSGVLGTRPEGWKLHGLVYFAPQDPALFVPKMRGIGTTLNFANWKAWAILLALLLLPVLLIAGV